MGLVIKALNDWRVFGRPQVAMHGSCHIFSFSLFFINFELDVDAPDCSVNIITVRNLSSIYSLLCLLQLHVFDCSCYICVD